MEECKRNTTGYSGKSHLPFLIMLSNILLTTELRYYHSKNAQPLSPMFLECNPASSGIFSSLFKMIQIKDGRAATVFKTRQV